MRDDVMPARRFERLSRLRDYEVARDESDPRGWSVVNGANRAIGRVNDLIVDTDRMTGCYLDVRIEAKAFRLREEHAHVLVPIELAHRVGDHHRLRIDELTREAVVEMTTAHEEQDLSFFEHWWQRDAADVPQDVLR